MIVAYYFISLALAIFYIFIIHQYYNGWTGLDSWEVPHGFKPSTRITVIVIGRNEAKNIESCLQSILKNKYPRELFELVFVDDHSTDQTLAIASSFSHPCLKILQLSDYKEQVTNSYKKRGIQFAIENSTGALILTTDADCEVGNQWLAQLAYHYEQTKKRIIAGPVIFQSTSNSIGYFQELDMIGMMAVNAGGIQNKWHQIANGANLAYERSLFEELEGFAGNDHLASGDDMFLIEKAARKNQEWIGFLKSRATIVRTEAELSLSSLKKQRHRWASKSSAYENWTLKIILILIFCFHINLIVGIVLIPFTGGLSLLVLMTGLFVKVIMDYLLLNQMTKYFDKGELMKKFFPALFWQFYFMLYSGWCAITNGKYEWKGRVVN